MAKQHKVILKEVGKNPQIVMLDGEYRSDAGYLIGSDITKEFVDLRKNEFCMIVDEDGKLKGLPHNFLLISNTTAFPYQSIVGTVVFVRYQWQNPWEEDLYDYKLLDVTEEDLRWVTQFLGNH